MTLECPNCNSMNFTRYLRPAEGHQGAIYRRKRCLNCRHVFLTAETVIAGDAAAEMLVEMSSSDPPLRRQASPSLGTSEKRAS